MSQGGGSRAPVVVDYARALKGLSAWGEAERVARFGVTEFPTESAFPLVLGETFLEQARWLEAQPWFQRALTLAPASAEAHYGLGRVALGQGRRAEAIRHLQRAAQYNPYHREALELLDRLQQAAAAPGPGGAT